MISCVRVKAALAHKEPDQLPSDGRLAVTQDRISHITLGATDLVPRRGLMIQYCFTKSTIELVIPLY